MWKRENRRGPRASRQPGAGTVLSAQTPSYSSMSSGGFDQTQKEPRTMHEELASIGKSIVINGELSGSEDLTIEGRVDGKIELRDHVLRSARAGRSRRRSAPSDRRPR